jgi:hypothetical protein
MKEGDDWRWAFAGRLRPSGPVVGGLAKNGKWSRGWTGLPKKTSQNQEGDRINFFEFKTRFWIQNQRIQRFSNWVQTEIILNKLFKDF